MSESMFRDVSREELLTVLTARQVEIIDHHLVTFGDSLHVTLLHEYMGGEIQPNGSYWASNQGRVFLHALSYRDFGHRDDFDYPADLGFFENGKDIQHLIQLYIFTERAKREAARR